MDKQGMVNQKLGVAGFCDLFQEDIYRWWKETDATHPVILEMQRMLRDQDITTIEAVKANLEDKYAVSSFESCLASESLRLTPASRRGSNHGFAFAMPMFTMIPVVEFVSSLVTPDLSALADRLAARVGPEYQVGLLPRLWQEHELRALSVFDRHLFASESDELLRSGRPMSGCSLMRRPESELPEQKDEPRTALFYLLGYIVGPDDRRLFPLFKKKAGDAVWEWLDQDLSRQLFNHMKMVFVPDYPDLLDGALRDGWEHYHEKSLSYKLYDALETIHPGASPDAVQVVITSHHKQGWVVEWRITACLAVQGHLVTLFTHSWPVENCDHPFTVVDGCHGPAGKLNDRGVTRIKIEKGLFDDLQADGLPLYMLPDGSWRPLGRSYLPQAAVADGVQTLKQALRHLIQDAPGHFLGTHYSGHLQENGLLTEADITWIREVLLDSEAFLHHDELVSGIAELGTPAAYDCVRYAIEEGYSFYRPTYVRLLAKLDQPGVFDYLVGIYKSYGGGKRLREVQQAALGSIARIALRTGNPDQMNVLRGLVLGTRAGARMFKYLVLDGHHHWLLAYHTDVDPQIVELLRVNFGLARQLLAVQNIELPERLRVRVRNLLLSDSLTEQLRGELLEICALVPGVIEDGLRYLMEKRRTWPAWLLSCDRMFQAAEPSVRMVRALFQGDDRSAKKLVRTMNHMDLEKIRRHPSRTIQRKMSAFSA